MNILVNGQQQTCRSCTIAELLAEKTLPPEALIVELNGNIIRQEQWPEVRLKDNDALELLSFMGGG